MKSKKLAALGLTAVLSLGLLTACSGGSDDTNETPAGSTPPVTESGAPAADSPANWTSVADLEGAKIAVQEGTTGNDVASAIPDAEVSAFKAVAQCGMELINGRVDCVIVDTHPAQSLVDANPDKLMVLDFPASEETETYAIATQKNDTGAALAEEFNTAMATLQENGTFDALVDKYISKNEDAQLPELKTVENPKGALVMGTNCEFEPFEYVGDDGETLTGARDVAARYDADPAARRLFDVYGEELAQFAGPVLTRFNADVLVLGGNISRAYPLFEPALERRFAADGIRVAVRTSALLDHAAMIGAASLFL